MSVADGALWSWRQSGIAWWPVQPNLWLLTSIPHSYPRRRCSPGPTCCLLSCVCAYDCEREQLVNNAAAPRIVQTYESERTVIGGLFLVSLLRRRRQKAFVLSTLVLAAEPINCTFTPYSVIPELRTTHLNVCLRWTGEQQSFSRFALVRAGTKSEVALARLYPDTKHRDL